MPSSETYKKLVVMTSRFPFPLEKGDKLRVYHQIKHLAKHFEIYLISTSEYKVSEALIDELRPYCKEIHVFPMNWGQKIGGIIWKFAQNLPFQVGYFHHFATQKKVNKLLERIAPDHIYCQLIRASEYVKNYHNCSKTIDYMDALSKGMERRANEASGIKKYVFNSEFRRLMKYENSIFEYFEHHTIISEQDKQYIFHTHRDKIHVIANGIDEYFLSHTEETKKEADIVFIGNMSYAPNVTAAEFIVKEILPQLPTETKVKIAGSSPSREVLRLASSQVEITGFVEDIRTAYKSAKLFVAPMFLGTGLQNKLLEAMALGIPCITTTLANNALKATPEKEILIANNTQEFIEQIKRLLKDEDLQAKIAANAKEFIAKNYQWEAVTQELVDLINNK